jgi:dimethylhistidine N-methyltransferase
MKAHAPTIANQGKPKSWHAQFLRDVVDGLRRPQKMIPCQYFYDTVGSALFEEICELDEYYLTRTELSILDGCLGEMVAAVGEDCVLIEFGSGSALKTRRLLERLESPRAYVPVDVGRTALEQSAQALAEQFPELLILPVHADFVRPFAVPETGEPRARRVVYFPGSTIGNFGPRAALELLRTIARLVGPGGGLLIGVDLAKDPAVVRPAYNDRRGVTAAFNLNLLTRINRELGADFDPPQFVHRAPYFPERERVEMHLVSRRAQIVRIGDDSFAIGAGEAILTECSYKYSPSRFERLTTRAGFTKHAEWRDSRSYFSVQYLIVE